jgi:hypothetical protein
MTMPDLNLRAAIYARVSSEWQAQEGTIASQLEALERRIHEDGLCCDPELRFIDDGVSGTLLLRPALERLRDQAAAGSFDRLYIRKQDGDGEGRYQVVAEEARVARKIFEWVGRDHCSLGDVARRLKAEGGRTRTGLTEWDPSTIAEMLRNPAYKGTAAYGKTRAGPYKPQRLRPLRGQPGLPRKPMTRVDTPAEDRILIDVPALVSEDLSAAAGEQLEENRKR